MPKPKRGPRFGSGPSHQRLMMGNLAMELFRHGRITTTEAKAKFLRPYAERLITKAKQGDLAARRQVLSRIHDRDVVAHLFEQIGPRFASRPGGYTRIIKLGPRSGDNAPMAIIELVDQGRGSAEVEIEESKRERGRGLFGRRRRQPEVVALAHDHDHDGDHDHDEDEDAGHLPGEVRSAADEPPADMAAPEAGDEQEPEEAEPEHADEADPDAGETTGGPAN